MRARRPLVLLTQSVRFSFVLRRCVCNVGKKEAGMAFQQCQQMADKKQPPADSTPMLIAVVQLSYCPQKKQWTHRQHSIACSKRRRVRTDQRAGDGVSKDEENEGKKKKLDENE